MRSHALLVTLAALASLGSSAQQPQVFRSSVDLVPVFATVTNADGSFARGLTKDDFMVLDNGKAQAISAFSSEAQTISASVIVDTSRSMGAALPRVYRAASAFLDNLLPGDRAMLGTLLYQGPALTSDIGRLRTALDLAPRDPISPLWNTLDRSLTTLAPETNRRVVVIYTSGENSGVRGSVTPERVLSRVEAEGVMVYAIGFEGRSISRPMRNIAVRSGGRATELAAKDDLGTALAAVAHELHQQYLLGFAPATFDGKVHTLEVRVTPKGLTVRARQSYVAKRE